MAETKFLNFIGTIGADPPGFFSSNADFAHHLPTHVFAGHSFLDDDEQPAALALAFPQFPDEALLIRVRPVRQMRALVLRGCL
ncbi:MAG: hypothetical protein IT562_13230 [Alphaproteobacteria bacterium]|nr:hypothetical protein [Alphaproteobacteria bacterium]